MTDQNFDAELEAPGRIVLVLFYDENISNRYLIEPIMEKLDERYGGLVKFCRLNIRDNEKAAGRYRILASPTLLFFKDGKLVESLEGTFPRIEVENAIQELLRDMIETS